MVNEMHILQGHTILAALIWFLPSVCPQMACKITIICESFVTVVALIWFLPSVFPQMDHKLTISQESCIDIINLL